jgi:hypothetical protein
VEGWKEELKEVRRVEDEHKAVIRDKEILCVAIPLFVSLG